MLVKLFLAREINLNGFGSVLTEM